MAPAVAPQPRPLGERMGRRMRPRGEPPGADEIRHVIESLSDEFAPVHARMRDTNDLFYSAYKIPLPKDIEQEGPTYVYTWKAAQQILQAEGLLGREKAQIRMAATNTRSDAARSRVEILQNHTQRAMSRLEQQADDPVFSKVTQSVLKHGMGIDCLEPDPRRIGSYGKSLDDFDGDAGAKAEQYAKDRKRFIGKMGERGGRLPMNLRYVDPLRFMYREDGNTGGLGLVVERRDLYAADVLDDPRYRDSAALDWLWREYYRSGTLSGRDERLAGAQKVSVWTIQDRDWTTQFLTPPIATPNASPRPEGQPVDVFNLTSDFGEIAHQARNPLGRPWYTVTKGLRLAGDGGPLGLIGVYFYATSLIKTLDWLLTIQANALKDQAWAPWVFIRGTPTVNGTQTPLLTSPQSRRIRIARGNGYVTELDMGTIQQLIAQAPPELMPMVEQVVRQQNLLLIPESLYDIAQSSSGYEYNSMRNSVLSRMTPILEGHELAMVRRADLYADQTIWMGETLSISTVAGDHLTETYAFDPKEYKELEITVDARFRVPRVEDSMADAQTAAFVVEKRLLDVARAREKYMGATNNDEIERDIALDDYRRSPKVAEFVIDKAATEAGLTLDQQAAEAQGDVSADQLLNTNPALLAALAKQAQPGMPGYAQIMQAAAQAGLVDVPTAAPQAAQTPEEGAMPAAEPAAPPVPMPTPGTPAGMRQASPGGPRMTGGFGGI